MMHRFIDDAGGHRHAELSGIDHEAIGEQMIGVSSCRKPQVGA